MSQTAQHALATDQRLTRDEYERRYAESGTHVELIDGKVFQMSPAGARHASLVYQLRRLLEAALNPTTFLAFQERTVRLPGPSNPEPDIAIVRGTRAAFAARHPEATDVVLLVEVADSSLDFDRQVKVPLYARHSIPEVWIVEAEAQLVRVYREPDGDASYRFVTAHAAHETIQPTGLSDVVIKVQDIFG